MARVNIEDSVFSDNRFYKLVALVGSKRVALGCLVEAWVVAQSQHTVENPGGCIPLAKWDEQECANELITCGLATLNGDHIYMKGGESQFKWLTDAKVNGAKGGRPKAKSPKKITHGLATLTATLPSSSSSSSSSFSLEKENIRQKPQLSLAPPPTCALVDLWNEHGDGLPKVKKVTEARRRSANKRFGDHTEGEWIEIIKACAQSKFLTGGGDRGWKATFDWLIKGNSAVRVLEGEFSQQQVVNDANRIW